MLGASRESHPSSSTAVAARARVLALSEQLTRQLATTDEPPVEKAEQLVDLVRGLAEGRREPFLNEYLLKGALEIEASLRDHPREPPASMRVGVELIRQALTRGSDRAAAGDDVPLHEIIDGMLTATHCSREALANLLGVRSETVRRWQTEVRPASQPESEEMQRARVLAVIISELKHAFTARGVLNWLTSPNPNLKHRAPSALLSDSALIPDLIGLASQGRSQVAS